MFQARNKIPELFCGSLIAHTFGAIKVAGDHYKTSVASNVFLKKK